MTFGQLAYLAMVVAGFVLYGASLAFAYVLCNVPTKPAARRAGRAASRPAATKPSGTGPAVRA